jgi:hypothetical protein
MRVALLRAVAVMLLVAAVVVVPAVVQGAPAAAPAFSLDLFNGQSLKLADLKGQAVILLFWAEW